jgi:hypothetical protein
MESLRPVSSHRLQNLQTLDHCATVVIARLPDLRFVTQSLSFGCDGGVSFVIPFAGPLDQRKALCSFVLFVDSVIYD